MRLAVVLFNLGGPDGPAAIRPFLVNLFSDPAILRIPVIFRFVLARLIAWQRVPMARMIYDQIGGRSPILPETRAQAAALETALADLGTVRCFVAMRYWHPRAAATVAEVKAFAPDHVVLLPLYPQFSTTTTASSLEEWKSQAKIAGLLAPTREIREFPTESGFISALAGLIREALPEAEGKGAVRILFSAHGLPQKIVAAGDPYPRQVEASAKAVMAALARDDLDWLVCYQSRVGPLKWLEPSTDQEIRRAGQDGVPVLVVPIAFVSEHSETLVELDIEYRHLAESLHLPAYIRVPTAGIRAEFIQGLADLVRRTLSKG